MGVELFFILLIAGLVLIGAEIFVPGGILGIAGAVALLGAVITGFFVFPQYGGWVALGVLFLAGLAIYLWVRFFPSSGVGKRMTVLGDLRESKGTDARLKDLLGKEGAALSGLRPSGFAEIDGRRVDVITRGEMLDKGTPLRVIQVESNRVVVTERKQD